MMRLRQLSLLSLMLVACVPFASRGIAFAAGATGLPVIVRPADAQGNELNGPGYFVVTARPGSTTHLYALVGNRSQQKAVVSIVPVDAATGVYGGVTAQLASQPRHRVGAWIHISTRKVKLGPDKGQIVPFALKVPKHTHPGQYVGALTAFVPSNVTKRGHGFAFTVQTRLADDVVVTVPGPRRWGFQIHGIRVQHRTIGTYVIARVRNSGTMMLKGWGYLWVWAPGQKKPVLAKPLTIDTTLPHTMVGYPLELGLHPRPGRYGFKLKVWWTGGKLVRSGNVQVR